MPYYNIKKKEWISDETLWKKVELKPVIEIKIEDLKLSAIRWHCLTIKSMVKEVNTINQASLNYPIIINENNMIIDGYHRVTKALLKGDETIKAVVLTQKELLSNET